MDVDCVDLHGLDRHGPRGDAVRRSIEPQARLARVRRQVAQHRAGRLSGSRQGRGAPRPLRSSSTRARCARPARACWCRRASRMPVLEKLQALGRKLQPGDPLDPATRSGAMVDETQMQRVLGYIESGRNDGATPARWAGGACARTAAAITSSRPCSTACVRHMAIAREEIFGPVLATISFETVDEAIADRQRRDLRTRRRGLDARCNRCAPHGARVAGRHGLHQLLRRRMTSRCRSVASSSPASAATSRCTLWTSTPN